MFPETKSRETSGLESENWQCFSRLLSRHFPPLFDPANGSSCLVERKSRNIRICYLYGFIESYSHHSSNHRYEYYKNKNGTKSVPCIWILQFMSRRSNSINQRSLASGFSWETTNRSLQLRVAVSRCRDFKFQQDAHFSSVHFIFIQPKYNTIQEYMQEL